MKNKEKYAKQIVDILLEEWHFAVNEDGYREVMGATEGMTADKVS